MKRICAAKVCLSLAAMAAYYVGAFIVYEWFMKGGQPTGDNKSAAVVLAMFWPILLAPAMLVYWFLDCRRP